MSLVLKTAKKFFIEGADLVSTCFRDRKARWEIEDTLAIENVVSPILQGPNSDLDALERKVLEQINQAELTWNGLHSRF